MTATRMIFSKKAAERILGTAIRTVKLVNRAVLVVYRHGDRWRSQFFTRRLFLDHFAEWRRQNAKTVAIQAQDDGRWSVAGRHEYAVVVNDTALRCECEDFLQQERLGFNISCCKHIYAALGQLGYRSLRHYLNTRHRSRTCAA